MNVTNFVQFEIVVRSMRIQVKQIRCRDDIEFQTVKTDTCEKKMRDMFCIISVLYGSSVLKLKFA